MRFTPAARLARKMLRDWWAQFVRQPNAEKPKSKTKVIMSLLLKSFEDLSLKVVALRTADDSRFGFEFPASGPQSTPSDLTTPLEQLSERSHDLPLEIHTWRHGGIND